MTGLITDLRHAIRVYGATPLASAIAVVALAVATAFVAALLSLWSDLAFDGHRGFERSDELITVGPANTSGIGGLQAWAIAEYDAATVTLQGLAGSDVSVSPCIERSGERVCSQAELVTAGYFEMLRPRLSLGSGFSADDHRADAEPVVVISDDLWRREFERRPDVIGASLALVHSRMTGYPGGPVNTPEPTFEDRHHQVRIVGVMAPEMHGTLERGPRIDFWMPHERMAPDFASVGAITMLISVGRLAADTTLEQAQAELEQRYPPGSAELRQLTMGPASTGRLVAVAGVATAPAMVSDGRRQVGIFLAGTLLLAIVAACNASLFLLSRAPTRRRELGIRVSIGATVQRLARQLATEAGLLVVAATAAGVLLSLWLAALLRNLAVFEDVRWRDLPTLDWRVLTMIVGLAAALCVVVALAPLLGLRREGIAAAAREASARAGWGQRLAGTAQVCIAAVVSAVAVAFAWQFVAFATADRGFEMRDISVIRISNRLTGREQGLTNADREALRVDRLESIANLPGVQAAALASSVPGEAVRARRYPAEELPAFELPDGEVWLARREFDGGFTDVLDLELAYGRSFEAADANPILVNETMAQSLWGRSNVVGEAFRQFTVVGVLRDVNFGHPAEPVVATYFARAGLVYDALVQSALPPGELTTLLQQQIDAGVLNLEIDGVERLADVWNAQLAADRARIRMSAAAAALIVLLAAFGFYGTQRYLVAAGRREYAIRAAIGANPRSLGRLVLRRGLELGLPGLLFGSLFAWIAVAWLRDDFVTASVPAFGVAAVVALTLLALVIAASLGPSRLVRNTAPAPLLRED